MATAEPEDFRAFAALRTRRGRRAGPRPERRFCLSVPASRQADAHVKELAAFGCSTTMHVAHLVAPRLEAEDHTKDIDFTAAGVGARREAGYADTMRMIERSPWQQQTDPIEGVIEHC